MRKKGYKVAICTGKDRYRTKDIIRYFGIEDCFDVLVCADDVDKPKPSPIPVIKALKDLNCKSMEAIMIGDGYADLLSAKAAGVRSVLSQWFGENNVPKESDYIANTVDELRKILLDNERLEESL